MTKTVLENLKSESERIQGLLNDLLAHSSIHRWHDPNTSSFMWIGGHFSWTALGDEGRQIQAQLLDRYRRFLAVVRALLRGHPDSTVEKVNDADRHVLEFVQQNEILFREDPRSYFESASKGLAALVELLNGLYGKADDKAILVPDTNALLFNPSIEQWRFTDAPKFLLILTAPVLSELDGLKINHRAETVRDKAEKLIRQIKEYRRRADTAGRKLADGVDVVSGISQIATLATEPKMEDSLPWLDPTNKDDRILAHAIEVVRTHARSPVSLVTRDINLQNKAGEFRGQVA
jgi:PIN domain